MRQSGFLLASVLGFVACRQAPTLSSVENSAQTVALKLSTEWVLKSDGLTEAPKSIAVEVSNPTNAKLATAQVDNALQKVAATGRSLTIPLDVSSLAVGEHTISVRDVEDKIVGTAKFQVSYPLYVIVSTDWDQTRWGREILTRMETLRTSHPGLKYSHFFAPYHYTDPNLTQAWRVEVDTWVKKQHAQYKDELGVHIHGWCHYVTTTSVPCRTKESFYQDDGSGYTTILAAYRQQEMEVILKEAVKTYEKNGLGTPKSFRAGGWTADMSTLQALISAGFDVDSSAVPPNRIVQWKGFELYNWLVKNWSGITETSQPYYPLASNIVKGDDARGIRLLEVPDNGALADYVTDVEMRDIFYQNFAGGKPLNKPTLYQVGFHPPSLLRFDERIDGALNYVDAHMNHKGKGPAVYATISDLKKVFKHK